MVGFNQNQQLKLFLLLVKPIDEEGLKLFTSTQKRKSSFWFDDCRIPFEEGHEPSDNQSMPDLRDVGKKSKEAIGIDKLSYGQVENAERKEYEQNSDGRFPANMLVSDEALNDYSKFFSLDSWFEENLKSLPEPVQKHFHLRLFQKPVNQKRTTD